MPTIPDDLDALALHDSNTKELTLQDALVADTDADTDVDVEQDVLPRVEHDSDGNLVPTDTESETDVRKTLHDRLESAKSDWLAEIDEHD